MTIALGAFVVMAAVVFGVYWLLIGGPDRKEAQAMQERIDTMHQVLLKPTFVNVDRPLSTIGPLNQLLSQIDPWLQPLRALIDRSGLTVTAGSAVLASLFSAAAAMTAVAYLYFSVPLVLLAGAVGLSVPTLYLRRTFQRRLALIEEQFPDAIDLMARSLRAGHSLPSAVQLVGTDVPNPIGAEFRLLFDRQNYGMVLDDALARFAARVPLIDARFFVTAVLVQREVGGNLSDVLDRLAAVVRERFKVKRQIRVTSAHGRITGWVLGLMPPALAAILLTIAPRYMGDLVHDPLGLQMVIGAAVLQVVGVILIKKIVNIEY